MPALLRSPCLSPTTPTQCLHTPCVRPTLHHLPLSPCPRLPLPPQVDVAVVGGGLTGLSCALALLRVDPTLKVKVSGEGG